MRTWDTASVAKALDQSPSGVRKYAAAGRIPGARKTIGGHWRFRGAAFEEWLEDQTGKVAQSGKVGKVGKGSTTDN